jgi:hypothetical protein
MECKITSTDPRGAFTLPEILVASGVGVLICGALISLGSFSNLSFAAAANYSALDQESQITVDKMSQELRQATQVIACNATNISVRDYDGATLQYSFDPSARTLIRTKGTLSTTNLSDCDSLNFTIYQRAPESNTFEAVLETSVTTNTKMVQVSWTCSRQLLGGRINSDSVQSAKIVLRNK